MNKIKPPQYALRFLHWFCPPALYEGIESDLLENFELDIEISGERKAKLLFILNVIDFFRPSIILRNKFSNELISMIMVGNYLKVASRNIAKRKLYSFINAFGLSIAIAFCALIYLFDQDEKSFDQMHVNKDRIFRLHTSNFDPEKFEKDDKDPYNSNPYLPAKFGEVLLDEFSEVQYMTRFNNYNEGVMRFKDKNFKQKYTSIDSGSLESEIEPMLLSMDKESAGYLTNMQIKIRPDNIPTTIERIQKAWKELYPDRPFDYTFLDQDVAKQYQSYERWMSIMGLATGFAILISCLGLFGLAGINAVNRTKEIGIRKVMGADLKTIFVLLNRQFIWLALVAFCIALPLSWWFITGWYLKDFTFQVPIGWELFAISMGAGLLLALGTVSYHAVKAALINPAETLKYE